MKPVFEKSCINLNNLTLDEVKRLLDIERDSRRRQSILAQISDQSFLKELVANALFGEERRIAARQLTDQELMKELLSEDVSPEIARIFLRKVRDRVFLNFFFSMTRNLRYYLYEIEQLWGQKALCRIARENADPVVRVEATEMIESQPVLAKIALYDENECVRAVAMCRVTDRFVLATIAECDENADIRYAAGYRLAMIA